MHLWHHAESQEGRRGARAAQWAGAPACKDRDGAAQGGAGFVELAKKHCKLKFEYPMLARDLIQ